MEAKQKAVDDISSRREKLFDFLERGIYTETVFTERMGKLENDLKEATASKIARIETEVFEEKMSKYKIK